MATKRIMHRFRIDEISLVDKPAQKGAKILLMKRDNSEDEVSADEMLKSVGAVLTSSLKGHSHLIDLCRPNGETSYNKATDEEYGHSHPYVVMADGSVEIGQASGHTHTVSPEMVATAIARLTADTMASLYKAEDYPGLYPKKDKKKGDDNKKKDKEKMDDLEKANNDLSKANTELKKANDQISRLNAIVNMSKEHKEHFDSLSTEFERDTFIAGTVTDRNTAISKALEANPVVYTSPFTKKEYRKNSDADFIKMAQDNDEMRKMLDEEKKLRKRQGFEKRAKEEMNNLPGDLDTQVVMLEAIDGITEVEKRDAVLAIIKAANDKRSAFFQTVGTGGGLDKSLSDPEQQINAMAKAYQEKHGTKSFEKAYDAVLDTPEGQRLYGLIPVPSYGATE